jgi:hypothetical protein
VPSRAEVVAAYWTHHRLPRGRRSERLAAAEYDWAWDFVDEAMRGDDDPLSLLDELLGAPEADPCYLGAGPVEDLLCREPGRWDQPMAERCARSLRWQEAVVCVWADDHVRRQLPALHQYLTRGR